MSTPYNLIDSVFDIAAKRAALRAALFPGGYPDQVLPIKQVGVASVTTGATTTIVTDRPHQLRTGQFVDVSGILGTVEANGLGRDVTVATPSEDQTSLTIAVNSTNAYTSGGVLTQKLDFTRNSIVANWRPWTKFNAASCEWVSTGVDRGVRYSFRYNHPRAGINRDKVLIWCHGHDSGAWATAYTTLSTTTPNSSSQRFMLHGLPTAPTNANWKVPLLNGIGVLEISGFGSYLNSIAQGFGNGSVAHDAFVADMGAEGVGMMLYPMIVAINAVLAAGKTPILGGFSGGGWATLLTMALDERVEIGFTQSGWSGVITNASTQGTGSRNPAMNDGEQNSTEVYSIANAHELALMGVSSGRQVHHIWSTAGSNTTDAFGMPSGSGADTVLGMTTADVQAMNSGGLTNLARRYGGELLFLGFDGLNDPVTTFATGSAASYTDGALLAAVASSAQNAGATPASFTFTATGHHVLQQTFDHIVNVCLQAG